MAIKTGIGVGSAQIFDTSRVDRAMYNAFDVMNRKKALSDKEKKQQEEAEKIAINEIEGKYDKFDPKTVRSRDVPVIMNAMGELNKRYSGNWQKVLQGDPEWANNYAKDIASINNLIGVSSEAKPLQKKYMDEINANPLISEEKKKEALESLTGVGLDINDWVNQGWTVRDEERPDFYNNINSLFVGDDDVLYDKIQTGTSGDYGGTKKDIKKWKDDSEAFPIFKNAVEGDAEMLTDINVKYSNLSTPEEKIQAAYEDYKQTTLDEWDKSVRTSKRPPKDTGAGDKTEDFSLTTFSSSAGEGIGISKPGNKRMQPFSATVWRKEDGKEKKTPTQIDPTSIEYDKKTGAFYMNGFSVKTVYNKDTEEQEVIKEDAERIKMPEGGQLMKDFKKRFKIKTTLKKWYENQLSGGGTETTDEDPLGIK